MILDVIFVVSPTISASGITGESNTAMTLRYQTQESASLSSCAPEIHSSSHTHVQISLQSLPAPQMINIPTQLCVISKMAEVAINPLVQIIGEVINQRGPKY